MCACNLYIGETCYDITSILKVALTVGMKIISFIGERSVILTKKRGSVTVSEEEL